MLTNEHIEIERLVNENLKKVTPVVQSKVNSELEIIFAGLYTRITNAYRAVNLLITKDFYIEALAVIRTALEARIIMMALLTKEKQEEVIERLHKLGEAHLQKTINNCAKWLEIKEKQEFSDSLFTSIKKFATMIGEQGESTYDGEYNFLCNSVHVNGHSIKQMLATDGETIFMTDTIAESDFFDRYDAFIVEVSLTLLQAVDLYKIEMNQELQQMFEIVLESIREHEKNIHRRLKMKFQWDDVDTEREALFNKMVDSAYNEDTVENESIREAIWHNPTMFKYFDVETYKKDLIADGWAILKASRGFTIIKLEKNGELKCL